MKRAFSISIAIVLLSFAWLFAQDAPSAPKLKEISPGIYEYNGIRLDKTARQISFPCLVNMRDGLLEYVLVNEKGKTHESLLRTTLLPHDLQVAMLLVGLKLSDIPAQKENVPPDAIDSSYLKSAGKLKGVPVKIALNWTAGGKANQCPVDEWIFNLEAKKTMSTGPWTYNGSLVEDGNFLADQELSIISVITDPTALVNNPREGFDNDQIWQPLPDKMPPLDTPVQLTITLIEP